MLTFNFSGFGIRLNKTPPNITFRKKEKGGVNLTCVVPQSELDLNSVKQVSMVGRSKKNAR